MVRKIFLIIVCVSFAGPIVAGDGKIRRAAEPVAGLYLVQLRDVLPRDVRPVAQSLVSGIGGKLRIAFQHATTGFSAAMTEQQALALANHPLVDFVEEVAVAHLSSEQLLPTDNRLWHLDRIDQATNAFDYKYDYCERASGVIAYVIGTGVYRDHSEFRNPDGTSRVVRGAKYANDDSVAPGDTGDYGYWPCGAGTSGDAYATSFPGHDTAVASLLAGKTYGVAKGVTIVPIRVVNCLGGSQTEWINWAIDWIMTPYDPDLGTGNPYSMRRPAVVSMSTYVFTQSCPPCADRSCTSSSDPRPLEASFLENEINKLVGHPYDTMVGCRTPERGEWSGIPMVVSANNQNTDQSYTSPARMAFSNTSFGTCGHVISVGGIDENDARWVWNTATEGPSPPYPVFCGPPITSPPTGSNYGPTVDIFAPAHRLTLAGISSPDAQETRDVVRSGTSYAAPIAAGVVARIQQALGPLSADAAWSVLSQTAALASSPIDPITGNRRIVHRDGASQCYPELP
jgi:hypothetical protein